MLQSIQYVGSGPATYVYSKKAVGTSGEYYHVFATETSGYDNKRDRKNERQISFAEKLAKEKAELEEFNIAESKSQDLQDVYQSEFGRSTLFLRRL